MDETRKLVKLCYTFRFNRIIDGRSWPVNAWTLLAIQFSVWNRASDCFLIMPGDNRTRGYSSCAYWLFDCRIRNNDRRRVTRLFVVFWFLPFFHVSFIIALWEIKSISNWCLFDGNKQQRCSVFICFRQTATTTEKRSCFLYSNVEYFWIDDFNKETRQFLIAPMAVLNWNTFQRGNIRIDNDVWNAPINLLTSWFPDYEWL